MIDAKHCVAARLLTFNLATLCAVGLSTTAAAAQPAAHDPIGQGASGATPEASPAAAPQPERVATGIADIVVTAEKRTTTVQRAPAAITVVTGSQLVARGIYNIQQAATLAPALKLGGEGTSTQAFIRGVGTTLNVSNTEPAVAINFNGVYIPREATGGSNIFDLERVEVLPGPQGTLYGRSATGGVINFAFKRPGTSFGGELLGEYGNYNYTHLFAAVDLPASDAARFRIAANYDKQDGYFRSGAGNDNDFAIRASTVLEPTDRLSIFLWGSYAGHKGSTPNAVNIPFLNPKDKYNDLQPPGLQPFGQTTKGKLDQDIYIAGGQIDLDLGGAKLTYIPSYVNIAIDNFLWLASIPNRVHYNVGLQANDLRLTNAPGSRLELLGGLYQFNQVYKHYTFTFPFGNIYDIPLSKEYGAAAYAQATYKLTSSLRTIVGARYSWTKRRAQANEFAGPGVPANPFSFEQSYRHFDWKLGVEADVAPRSMAYAIVQTGFNPGTFNNNPSVPGLSKSIRPTKLRSYTAGIKNRFLDNRLQLNLEGFYYDYRDLLISSFNTLTGQQQLYNAKKVQIYGGQVDARVRLARNTELNVAAGYLHAENKNFVVPQIVGPSFNYNGLTPPYAPRLTLNLGASQTIPFARGDDLVARVDSHHETKAAGDFDHAPGTGLNNYWKTDISLTYTTASRAISVAGWVRNIENSWHPSITASGGLPGPGSDLLERPRTFGVRVGYDF